jgi:hypothetical protein
MQFSDIRTAHDAHVVFEAVRRGLLPMITHRLSAADRDLLRSGEVFCWEEADYKGGLERWTDGRKWCVSNVWIRRTHNADLVCSKYTGASLECGNPSCSILRTL